MRILDIDNNKAIKKVILYLKIDEAKEFLSDLKGLIDKNDLYEHVHIGDALFEHEITLVIYNEKKINMLNERSQRLIEHDL